MSGAGTIRLGELLKVQNGFAFKKEFFSASAGVPLIRIRDLEGTSTEINYCGPYREEFLVEAGDYLIGMDGEFHCNIWRGPRALLNQRVCRLLDFDGRLNSMYLYYGIRKYLKEIEDHTAFVTVKHISGRQIEDIRIPLPPIEVQRRIVDVLSRAEAVVRMRREAEAKAKEIIPALFVDMFEDPANSGLDAGSEVWREAGNTAHESGRAGSGWEIKRIGEVVRNLDASRRPVKSSERSEMSGVHPYFGASGIIDHVNGYTHEEPALLVAEDGANLLSRSTPIAFQADGKFWVNNHAHVLGYSGLAELTYLEVALNQRDLREHITGSAQPKLTQRALLDLALPIPPISLQRAFSQRVNETRNIASIQRTALRGAEHVFQSLLAGVFGEGG